MTTLHYAANNGHSEAMKTLVDLGATTINDKNDEVSNVSCRCDNVSLCIK